MTPAVASSANAALPAATSDKKRKRSRGGANKNKSNPFQTQQQPQPASSVVGSVPEAGNSAVPLQSIPNAGPNAEQSKTARKQKKDADQNSDSDSGSDQDEADATKEDGTKSGGRKRVRKRKSKKKAAALKALEEEKKAWEPLGDEPPSSKELGPDPAEDERLNEAARSALLYARQYVLSRPTWKFHKARQNWLLRHVLNVPPPAADAERKQSIDVQSEADRAPEAGEKSTSDSAKSQNGEVEGENEKTNPESNADADQEADEKDKEESMSIPEDYLRMVGWYLRGIQGGAKDRLLSTLLSKYHSVPIQEPHITPSVPPPSFLSSNSHNSTGLGDLAMEMEKQEEEADKEKQENERERRRKWFGRVVWSMGEKIDA